MVVHSGQQLLHGQDAQRHRNDKTEHNGLEEFAAKGQPEAAICGAKDFTDADLLLPSFHDETGRFMRIIFLWNWIRDVREIGGVLRTGKGSR